MPSAGAGQRGALVLGWVHVRWPNLGARSGYPGLNTQGGVILKTPKMIGLLAVPVVLAAAVVSATGAFAKAPAHHAAAAASVATAKLSAVGAADAAKLAPAVVPAAPAPDVAPATPSQPAAEPAESTTEAAEPAGTETADAAGGHADDPNDPNADHQFNGEE